MPATARNKMMSYKFDVLYFLFWECSVEEYSNITYIL
jgi:hypothetical protein